MAKIFFGWSMHDSIWTAWKPVDFNSSVTHSSLVNGSRQDKLVALLGLSTQLFVRTSSTTNIISLIQVHPSTNNNHDDRPKELQVSLLQQPLGGGHRRILCQDLWRMWTDDGSRQKQGDFPWQYGCDDVAQQQFLSILQWAVAWEKSHPSRISGTCHFCCGCRGRKTFDQWILVPCCWPTKLNRILIFQPTNNNIITELEFLFDFAHQIARRFEKYIGRTPS